MPPQHLPSSPRQAADDRPGPAGPQARLEALRAAIAQGRAALAAWQDRLARERQLLEPLQRALRAAWREWLLALDHAALQPGFSRAERRQLAARLHAWAVALGPAGEDAALDALAQRHAPQAEAPPPAPAPSQPAAAEPDEQEAPDEDHEAWERQAEAAAAQRAQAAARRRAAGSAKRQAAQAQEASASVREVFRRLASALHPDRETDPAERERKTGLMQQANGAYATGDLPALLDLQLQAERVAAARPAATTARQLQHRIDILQTQLAALQAETRELEAAFREGHGLPPGVGLAPRKADRLLGAQAQRLREDLAAVRQLARMPLDVPALRAWLRSAEP